LDSKKITQDIDKILSDDSLRSKLSIGLKRLFSTKTSIVKVGDKKLKVIDNKSTKRFQSGGRYDLIRLGSSGG